MVSQVEIIKISPELHRNKHIPSFSNWCYQYSMNIEYIVTLVFIKRIDQQG